MEGLLTGKFTAPNVYISKGERPQINNISFHLKNLENESEINPKQAEGEKQNKTKQTCSVRTEISEFETEQ